MKAVAEALGRIAESEDGRVVFDYLERYLNARTTYVVGDPYGMHYREGMRALYLHLRRLIEWARSGVEDYRVATEESIWEQVKPIQNVEEEISDADYGD